MLVGSQVDRTVPLLHLLWAVPCSSWTWPEAELYQCVRYARGKRGLKVPQGQEDVDAYLRDTLSSANMSDQD